MRGTGSWRKKSAAPRRFIPACAGNRDIQQLSGTALTVHPRVCGEQGTVGCKRPFRAGSSPRVRGTVDSAIPLSRLLRFIPACAGNRIRPEAAAVAVPVHPRVCGEQTLTTIYNDLRIGSSPRVRGTDVSEIAMYAVQRFIPACAGNRGSAYVQAALRTVHPRVCGEQLTGWGPALLATGSSPRVRGTASATATAWQYARFIPACAGNRSCRLSYSDPLAAHPRVCGEQFQHPGQLRIRFGSSPRVRGTVTERLTPVFQLRFIPACAGNSPRSAKRGSIGTVHPRVCGEQPAADLESGLRYGSSPRVRGTAPKVIPEILHTRFIPACAGNRFQSKWSSLTRTVHPRVCGEQGSIRRGYRT